MQSLTSPASALTSATLNKTLAYEFPKSISIYKPARNIYRYDEQLLTPVLTLTL